MFSHSSLLAILKKQKVDAMLRSKKCFDLIEA